MILYILTLFNYKRQPIEPVSTLIYDGNKLTSFVMYQPGSGISLSKVDKNVQTIKHIIESGTKIVINDFKAHVDAFGIEKYLPDNIYDNACYIPDYPLIPQDANIIFSKYIGDFTKTKPMEWMKLRARAAVVYSYLQEKGVFYSYKTYHPQYEQHTFTGRSKTSGFNLQGMSKKQDIRPVSEHQWMIHLDWIATDIRIFSLLSDDENLKRSFIESDPYTFIAGDILDRKECKIGLLKAINKLDYEDEILDFFPSFREWMAKSIDKAKHDGYLETIMGRRFYLEEDEPAAHRQIFNAVAQGSVVHAMQASITKIFERYASYLMAEIHDSIVCSSNRPMMEILANDVSSIMLKPFKGILDSNPSFPLKISIGQKWKKWETWKEIRVV
jgi:hypothetical protein